MKTDIELAREASLQPIEQIAAKLGIEQGELASYGKYIAKVSPQVGGRLKDVPNGKLVLVTAITPTPSGEGKTTVSIGLADALSRIGERTLVALREPSMGPVFGVKGGAAGGGMAQVLPMEDINLHFTGDIHAIGSANNLLAAMVDNHIFQGNELDIQSVTWRRCMDMNDRQLRSIQSGLGGEKDGVPRVDGFDITAASEVMAVLCLSRDLSELKANLKNIIVGYNSENEPVLAGQLKAEGAMATVLKSAMQPNLVQTMEGTPALIHGGPFANIAHGCSSLAATLLSLKLADYTVTEAGFGADLGAEKFLDIKCRKGGIWPNACVIVATVKALKYHGGEHDGTAQGAMAALEKGLENLGKHVENMTGAFALPTVVAINRFESDTDEELAAIKAYCARLGVESVLCEVWAKGGAGGEELARAVVRCASGDNRGARHVYELELPITKKIERIAQSIYGATSVEFLDGALDEIHHLEKCGFGKLSVCVAKTQMSISDDPALKGRPTGFNLKVRQVKVSAGAGFILALTGKIMTMPGLSKSPAAERIDVDSLGRIDGLF